MQPDGTNTPGNLPEQPQSEAAPEQSIPAQAPETSWQFKPDEAEDFAEQPPSYKPIEPISWTASEYVAHDKGLIWYLMVVLGSVMIAAIIYMVTGDKVSAGVVAVLGIAFAAFGARKPQVLEYTIDNSGIKIGQKQYTYDMYKTFSILEEDATRSILLMPLRRFNLPLSIYYVPADEEKIIEALSVHLPHENRTAGPIDNFMRKIRF